MSQLGWFAGRLLFAVLGSRELWLLWSDKLLSVTTRVYMAEIAESAMRFRRLKPKNWIEPMFGT